MAEWSARRTRNPAVPGSSPALATCWIWTCWCVLPLVYTAAPGTALSALLDDCAYHSHIQHQGYVPSYALLSGSLLLHLENKEQ